jgi:hypothetical protein
MYMVKMAGYAEVNEVLRKADRSPGVPIQLTDAQLVGLQVRWHSALSARLDAVLEMESDDYRLFVAVAEVWRELASRYQLVRTLIDAHEGASLALAEAQRVESRMLALAARISGIDDPTDQAVSVGRAYRRLVRTQPMAA